MASDRIFVDQVNVVVPDMDAAVAFYRALGFEVQESGDEWDNHHRRVNAGGTLGFDLDSVSFAKMWNRGWQGGGGVVVTFRTEEREAVDRLFERLIAAGYEGDQPPFDAMWGARFAVIRDPAGNSIGIMSPVDPARRAPPTFPPDLE